MSSSTTPINFTWWVLQFVNEKSDRGIFARWFIDNLGYNTITSRFAKFKYTRTSYRNQMIKNGCSKFILQMYDECWEEFEQVPNAIIITNNRGRMRE